jgi:transcriptional regulator with XRE-family HTH domain
MRLARHDLMAVGREIRTARISRGLTIASVAAAVGLSPSQVGRIERGVHPSATAAQLARIGAVAGLDVRVRAYPGPAATRDTGQIKLMHRFRERLHPKLLLRLEVPVAPADQRAWDAVVSGFVDAPQPFVPTEFDSVIVDFQAQLRRMTLKCADAGSECLIWVVAATRRNRTAIRAVRTLVADTFPVSSRTALRALREGRYPGGSSLILL